MEAGADVDSELTDGFRDLGRAADGPGRAVEAREESVPGRIKLLPAKVIELGADERMVGG